MPEQYSQIKRASLGLNGLDLGSPADHELPWMGRFEKHIGPGGTISMPRDRRSDLKRAIYAIAPPQHQEY